MTALQQDLDAWTERHVEATRKAGWQLAENVWRRGVPEINTYDRMGAQSPFRGVIELWDYVLTVDSKPECWEALLVMARHNPVAFLSHTRVTKYTLSPRVTALVIAAELRI